MRDGDAGASVRWHVVGETVTLLAMCPAWALPPLVGLYGLIRDLGSGLSWGLLAALVLFCLCGFVLLPIASQKTCAGCATVEECPPGASRDSFPSPEPQD